MKKQNKIWIFLILAILMTNIPISDVFASNVNDLKKQQEEIKKEIEETQKQLKEMESQTKSIEGQIKELDIRVTNAAAELENVEVELEIISQEIDKTQEALEKAEENIVEKTETFEKRIRTMYKRGNVGYLELLLSSKDIRDFLNRQDMVEAIANQDRELIQYMKEQRDTIDENKRQLEVQKVSMEETRANIERRRETLEKTSLEKEHLMEKLMEDISAFEKEYDKLNDLAKEIEREIIKRSSNSGPYTGGRMQWPVPNYTRISSPYGNRIHPIFKVPKLHTGIDIPAPTGTNVIAAAAGKVIMSGWLGGYGNVIMIDHNGGIVTLYAHNSSLVAREGAIVAKGDVIAKIGSTGNSTGPHLHFEVRNKGAYVDPIPWLRGN